MFLISRDRVITYKGASLVVNDEMMQKAADIIGVSVQDIRDATEKFFNESTINKKRETTLSIKSSDGLQIRLQQLAKGK